MDMSLPGAYFEDCYETCKASVDIIDRQIAELKAKQEVYRDLQYKLQQAIDKEKRKASGEIEY